MTLPFLVYILGIYESLYSWVDTITPQEGIIYLLIIAIIILSFVIFAVYADNICRNLPNDTEDEPPRDFILFFTTWFGYIIRPKYVKIFIVYATCMNFFQVLIPQPKVFYTMIGAYYVQKATEKLDKEAIQEELKVLPPNILKAINATLEKTFEEAIAEANGLVTETTEIAKDSLKEISKEATTKVIEKIKEQ